ncbi:uncharacterized protein [Mytilus edulis]|uniref:uncharacterized protein n=1 Tax=Mytilus edulis TaxID=6550 RepID=UPI0039EE24F0
MSMHRIFGGGGNSNQRDREERPQTEGYGRPPIYQDYQNQERVQQLQRYLDRIDGHGRGQRYESYSDNNNSYQQGQGSNRDGHSRGQRYESYSDNNNSYQQGQGSNRDGHGRGQRYESYSDNNNSYQQGQGSNRDGHGRGQRYQGYSDNNNSYQQGQRYNRGGYQQYDDRRLQRSGVEDLELKPLLSAKEVSMVIHGTYYIAWEKIKQTGLSRMGRDHIHFSAGEPGENGVISGMRQYCEVMIFINLEAALADGFKFFRSANNVILCAGNDDGVIPPKYFVEAVQRNPRQRLEFDENVKVVKVPIGGASLVQDKKGKKNKNKKSKGDREKEKGTETQKKKDKTEIDETAMEDTTQMFNEKMEVDSPSGSKAVDVPRKSKAQNEKAPSGSGVLSKLKYDNWEDEDKFEDGIQQQEMEEKFENAAQHEETEEEFAEIAHDDNVNPSKDCEIITTDEAENNSHAVDYLKKLQYEENGVQESVNNKNDVESTMFNEDEEFPNSSDFVHHLEDSADGSCTGEEFICSAYDEIITIVEHDAGVSAVDFLMEKDVVAVHVELSDYHDALRRITCITEDKSYIFDVETNPYLIMAGRVAEFFSWTLEPKGPIKVFNGLDSKTCALLFDRYEIILDGTKIFDLKIAYNWMMERGLGNITDLKKTGFKPDCIPVDTDNVTSVCLPYLKAYQYFSQLLHEEMKCYKKQLFEMVNADICKEDLKRLRERNKRELKIAEYSQPAVSLQSYHRQSSKSKKVNKMMDFPFSPLPTKLDETEKEDKFEIIQSNTSSSSQNMTASEKLLKNFNLTSNLPVGSSHPSLNNDLQQEFNDTRQMARQCAIQKSQEEQCQVIAVVKHESVEFPDGRRYTCRSTVVPDPVIVEGKSTATQTVSHKCKDVGVQCEIIDWNKYQKMIELAEVLLK